MIKARALAHLQETLNIESTPDFITILALEKHQSSCQTALRATAYGQTVGSAEHIHRQSHPDPEKMDDFATYPFVFQLMALAA